MSYSSVQIYRGLRKQLGPVSLENMANILHPVADPAGSQPAPPPPPVQGPKNKKMTRFRLKYAPECVI